MPIVARSVAADAESPFDLSGPEARGAGFLEVLWRGRSLRDLQLTLEWSDGFTDRFTIRYEDLLERTYVSAVAIEGPAPPGGERGEPAGVWEAVARPYPDHETYDLVEGVATDQLEFRGLVPRVTADDATLERAKALQARLTRLRGTTQWIGSTRVQPPRRVPTRGSRPRGVRPDGANAAEIVVSDREILRDVARWYARDEIGRELRVEQTGTERRLLLDHAGLASHRVDLCDTGEGMGQVLPVLVAAALASRNAVHGPAFVAIEDPEAHLHENARCALAAHLCEVAASERPPTLVLETHSRTFLLEVQKAVAQGRLDADRVAVVWVEQGTDGQRQSEAQTVTLDSLGRLQSTALSGLLREDEALARELLALQMPGNKAR